MSEWIGELRSALTREFGDGKPCVATLATVDRSGAPRARTVVCRRVADDGTLYVASDARSEKNDQVKASAQAEVVFWLPTLREQYRVLGSVRVGGPAAAGTGGTGDPARAELWRAMSDAGRALFLWASPGARRVDAPEAFPTAVPAAAAVPPNFELIVVRPRRVEHLQLTVHPHRRRRWMLAGKWSAAAELNP
jgi:PPOX class probable FMN-dependent enzyme